MSNTPPSEIIVDGSSSTAIARAVEILRGGGLIGIPTETVYGLAADVENENALRRIFIVKNRPATHPLIVHIHDASLLDDWGRNIPPSARELARIFWPGPLTMLLYRSKRVSLMATGGRETVALRVPAHGVALELLREFNGALAAPSANRFSKVSPTTAQHVLTDLGSDVDLILDGGPCTIGVESTILDMTSPIPQLLRPGSISIEHIEAILNIKLDSPSGSSRASGMLKSHYAPNCVVELVESAQAAQVRAQFLETNSLHVRVLDYSHDLNAYAKNLYEFLRLADRAECDVVVAVMPVAVGIGIAIRDRLSKAAAR
ncbi:MAG: L-threonylcarbamoyladenylate synthase [Ilumatobacteraceae bacterium]